jgi:NitT/TauT family transport system permease protein
MTRESARPWESFFWAFLTAIVIVAIWHTLVVWSGTRVFPSPLRVQQGIAELIEKGLFFSYLRDSLFRVGAGYLLAAALGIPAGLFLGWHSLAAYIVNPLIQMLRPISPLAWIPLAVIWFGAGNAAAIFLIFLSSFFAIVVATMNGVRNVPPMYRQAGQNFGLSPGALVRRVIFPAALPQILVGLRIALGISWLVIVAAEMIAVTSGLGYLILDSRNAGQRYDLVVAGMLIVGVIGLALDVAMSRLTRRKSVRWGVQQ